VNLPIASWASWVASGCSESYVHRTRPSVCTARPVSSPPATAVRPGGVVMRKVIGARRLGWSFDGKIILAPLGCGYSTVPSGVGIQP
jgi:hypothetical protein